MALNRDCYSPCWTVTFTVDVAPWFGDDISVEVQEIGKNAMEADLDSLTFVDEHIVCHHDGGDGLPNEHWARGLE